MRYGLKSKLNIIIKSVIIFIVAIFLENQTNNVVLNAQNSNLNKQLSLSSFAVVDITNDEYNAPDSEKEPVKQEEVVQEEPKNLINAKLTGYVFNCPSCSGKLACDSSINLSNGNVNYNDSTYGNVRIVASSSNLACGSIVSINASKLSSEPIIAIVLDRGVSGSKLDLLTSSVHDAKTNIGKTNITYEVLRNGY